MGLHTLIHKPTRNTQKVQHLSSKNCSIKSRLYWNWYKNILLWIHIWKQKLSSSLWTLVNIWVLKYLTVLSRCHWLGRLCMHLLLFMESQKTPRTTRIDAVWDCYHKHNLKNQTCTKRQACGGIQRTSVSTKIPIPWGNDSQQFLSINQNKGDLFRQLSTELISATANTTACCVISTSGQNALSNQHCWLRCCGTVNPPLPCIPKPWCNRSLDRFWLWKN